MKFLSILILSSNSLSCVQTESSASLCFLPNIEENSSNICKDESGDFSCANDSVIMIRDIRYEKKQGGIINNCNDCVGGGQVHDWDVHPKFFEYKLYQTCSSQNSCVFNETVEIPSAGLHYVWYAHIEYDCIPSGLFHNICSPLEKTLGRSESVHILLGGIDSLPRSCSCLIESGNFGILVVDYRPYFNDIQCADSSVFVDGNQHFPCSDHTGIDASVYNTPINVTNSRANITISIREKLPQMFWVNVEGQPDVIVKCNPEVNGSSEQTRRSTKTTTTTPVTTTTASTTELVTDEQDSTLIVESTSSLSHIAGDSENSDFPIPVIVGGLTGLMSLVVLVTVCANLVRKRKLCKKSQTKYNDDVYNTVRFEDRNEKRSRIMNVSSNETYTKAIDVKENTPYSSIEQEVETDNVYSQPIDVVVNEPSSEGTETVTDMRASYTYRKVEKANDYEKPYIQTSISKEQDSSLTYAIPVKDNAKMTALYSLSGLDNTYSHIHGFTEKKLPLCLDNYSHVKIKQTDASNMNPGMSIDLYSHLPVDTTDQNSYGSTLDQSDHNVDDTGDYDHLGYL